MLISVRCLLSCSVNDFVDGVYTDTLVRICPYALSSDHRLRKVRWVDATGPQLCRVIVDALVIHDCNASVRFLNHLVQAIMPSAPGAPEQFFPESLNGAQNDRS